MPRGARLDAPRTLHHVIVRGIERRNMNIEKLRSGSRIREVSKLRTTLALQLVNELGLSLAESARQLGVSTSAIAQILRRQS